MTGVYKLLTCTVKRPRFERLLCTDGCDVDDEPSYAGVRLKVLPVNGIQDDRRRQVQSPVPVEFDGVSLMDKHPRNVTQRRCVVNEYGLSEVLRLSADTLEDVDELTVNRRLVDVGQVDGPRL